MRVNTFNPAWRSIGRGHHAVKAGIACGGKADSSLNEKAHGSARSCCEARRDGLMDESVAVDQGIVLFFTPNAVDKTLRTSEGSPRLGRPPRRLPLSAA